MSGPEGDRSRLIRHHGIAIVADCYNANPTSMRAALATLIDFTGAKRRIAVLGAMRELGDEQARLHNEVGAVASQLDIVVTVGADARAYRDNHATSSARWIHTESRADAVQALLSLLRSGDAVLIKASHSEHLEEVVAGIVSARPAVPVKK